MLERGHRQDVSSKVESAQGFEVIRVVMGHAYAANGNSGNPTPRFRWEVYRAGALWGTAYNRRGTKDLIKIIMEDL